MGQISAHDPDNGDTISYSINPGLDGSLFALSGSVLRVADSSGLDASVTPNLQVSIRATDSSGAYYDKIFSIEVQGYNQVSLTSADDVLTNLPVHTQVTGALTSLNDGDQIAGPGDTAVVVYGAGAVDLNNLATFEGVSEFDLIQFSQGTSSLTLKSGQDLLVRNSGTGDLDLTTSDGHATISSTTTGAVTLTGSSGQVDGSFTSQNLTVNQGSGAMTLSETGTWPAGVNIHAGSGDMTFTGYGQAYSTSIQGGSGTLNVDLSGSNDFGVTLSTGSGQVTFKSNTGASHVSVTVAGEANWHDGNVIDFNGQSESHFTFNGTGGQFVDLTQSSIIAPHYMTLNDDTFVVNSDTMDGVVDLSGSNATVQTADAALDLHSLTSSDLQFSSTNGTGTTFTVANAAVGLDVLGGAGNNDTLIGDGFSFTADQREAIFATSLIETIQDASGTYTAPTDIVKLTTGADEVDLQTIGMTVAAVVGTGATLNAGDQLTGAGDSTLALYGGGTFDLSGLAHFEGFSDVGLSNYSNSVATATLTAGQDFSVATSGTGDLDLTTSDGHATISSTTTGAVTLTGSSGQVDGSFTSQNLTVNQGSGAMTLSETGTWPAGVNIHAGSGDMTFTGYGQAYSTSIQGGSGTLNVDLSGSNDFGVTLSTGSGQVTFKSNTGASHVSVTVAGEANWHDGNVIDFNGQSESHFTFNGTGGQFVDLTQSSIIAPHYMTLNDDTFVVNSDTMDGVVDLSGSNATVQTADAALDLHSLTSSDLQFSSTNGTGTTFTVANAAVGLDVLGGAGNNDTLIGDGFSFTADQREAIFATSLIETIQDASGTYTAPTDIVKLTTGADEVDLQTIGMTVAAVVGTGATLNAGDQLTGAGDSTLALYGGGTFDLSGLAHFEGFSDVGLSNYSNSVATATLTAGQDFSVATSGTGDLDLTTSDGHATISSTTTGAVTLTGSSGQVDGSFTSQNLTVN